MTRWGIAAVVLVAGALLAGCGGATASSPTVETRSSSASGSAPAPVAGPTAETVVDKFQAAGLKVAHARDNSAGCASLGCVQRVTTDAITVLTFKDEASAAKVASGYGADAHQQGTVVLEYAAAKTPAADRPKYEAELAKLAG